MDPIQPPDETTDSSDHTSISQPRLRVFVTNEYRSIVLRRLGVTVEWRTLNWVAAAACGDDGEATQATCRRCTVVAECLAAAIASDDPADWRGGLDRADRERLWAGLDRTYGELRDLESMRLDGGHLGHRDHPLRSRHSDHADPSTNGARS